MHILRCVCSLAVAFAANDAIATVISVPIRVQLIEFFIIKLIASVFIVQVILLPTLVTTVDLKILYGMC